MRRSLVVFAVVVLLLVVGVVLLAEAPVSPAQQHVEQVVPDAQITH